MSLNLKAALFEDPDNDGDVEIIMTGCHGVEVYGYLSRDDQTALRHWLGKATEKEPKP